MVRHEKAHTDDDSDDGERPEGDRAHALSIGARVPVL
jgi:hypothetical protein